MNGSFVLDCSVTMAWFFDGEATPLTDEILDHLNQSGSAIVAGHWLLEVTNTVLMAERRKRCTPSDSAHFMGILRSLAIEVDRETGARAFSETLALARTHSLSQYDAGRISGGAPRGNGPFDSVSRLASNWAWSLMRVGWTRLLPETMTSPCVSVAIHPSLFPDAVHARLRASFQTRRIHGAFHYDTARRAHRWMAVHAAHSPAVTAEDARSIYDQAARESVVGLQPGPWGCIGLGCGSGHKEARVVAALAAQGSSVTYLPLDVSVPLVLISREAALAQVPNLKVHPIAADLTDASD
ncbi:MAG: hypothetical protein EBU81_07920, partial [Proteobacteria bacterium]|nr:hypothetical protein [Pseudomonadota bacterium]